MNSNSFIRVQKKYFFAFKFEFGKMIELFRVQVRVRSPDCSYKFLKGEAEEGVKIFMGGLKKL